MAGMIVYDQMEQGTPEWFECRRGVPTASMFSSILAKGEGKMRRSYLYRLAAEIVTGEPTETYTNASMERGRVMEAEARERYAFDHDAEPRIVGFIRNGDKGCSPDSLLGTNGMLEIKIQRADLLIDLLMRDRPPPEHAAQCQGQLWVAEREWVDLCVYWPKMKMSVHRIHRDEAYIATLANAVDAFNEELAQLVQRVRSL